LELVLDTAFETSVATAPSGANDPTCVTDTAVVAAVVVAVVPDVAAEVEVGVAFEFEFEGVVVTAPGEVTDEMDLATLGEGVLIVPNDDPLRRGRGQ
jgi:hypothetical protein